MGDPGEVALFWCNKHGLSPWEKDCPWCWFQDIEAQGKVVIGVVA